jgi:predicted nucleotidyltransferase
MRITLHEAEIIVKHAKIIFGENTEVILFGSRTDDTQKGGDIDLYIEPQSHFNLMENKLEYLSLLEKQLGEQKIDVVFKKDSTHPIDKQVSLKGIKLDIATLKLKTYFNQCHKHIQRIDEAYDDMKHIIPLSVEKYKNLNKDEVQDIDQYIFRFSKLQDTMGDKIFKMILTQYEGHETHIPFMDLLNKLEKFGCISSAKEWSYLRKLRNEISHQYDDEPEEMTQAINALLSQKEIIKNIFTQLENCI